MPTFSPEALEQFAASVFVAAGVPAEHAAIVSRSLVDSNLCGHDSHGVIRVTQYVGFLKDGKLTKDSKFAVVTETPAMLSVDGQWGLGQVQAFTVLEKLWEKARTLGVASGTLRRTGHIGRLGEYAEWAAAKGCALFATVNSHGSGRRVAPPGGVQGRISTNPICFGSPTPAAPLVLDFSTSVCAEGKVRVAHQKGGTVPAGWIQNSKGEPTTNPADLYGDPPGTILPFGGEQTYKGFGLGLMLDALAGGLSGGDCSRPDRPMPGMANCVVFVLWNTALFGGSENFLQTVGGLSEFVRNTPLAPGVNEITLPGDPERRSKAARRANGIPIPDGTWNPLVKLATELNVPLPQESTGGAA